MNTNYIGEHILPGLLGKSFIWVSLLTLVISACLFVFATKRTNFGKLKFWASTFFVVHFIALFAAIGSLYYLIVNHCFEYSYVYQYSSANMQPKYTVSCFWAGQEGSFLIWSLFTGLLGIILLQTSKNWKSWVMPVFSMAQLFLLCMVLGVEFFGISIGESPFVLLREMAQNLHDPFFKNPNYVNSIGDGQGLNPLLENYWMVIHPPALFLGYAAVFVPVSYAVASLWRKRYHAWLKPVLPWTAVALLTLGGGIFLGGRWAYESLTFGGFWAWDPVENASLVPWLFLVAALHLLIIASKRHHSYKTAYLFVFFSSFFVMYATYLTRSGVLGQTSVHSFGDNNQASLMLVFTMLFIILPLVLLLFRYKSIPKKENDMLLSREFWMLLGSIVAILSAFQIIVTTSIPVFNKVLSLNLAPPVDPVRFYNLWQLPFAIFIILIMAISQYLWYGQKVLHGVGKKILRALGIAILCTLLIAWLGKINRVDYLLLLFSSVFAVCVSVAYIIRYVRHIPNVAAAITHLGFAVFVIGILLAFSNTQTISKNASNSGHNADNVALYKGKQQIMENYLVTFSKTDTVGTYEYYQIDFVKKSDSLSNKIAFSLRPSINFNRQMGKVHHPDTKHFFDKDIYAYISFSQDATNANHTKMQEMNIKDTVAAGDYWAVFDSIFVDMKSNDFENVLLTAQFRILDSKKHEVLQTKAIYQVKGDDVLHTDANMDLLGFQIRFDGVSQNSSAILVAVSEKGKEHIVLKIMVFPFINVLWTGAIIMFLGLLYSIYKRSRRYYDVSPQNVS